MYCTNLAGYIVLFQPCHGFFRYEKVRVVGKGAFGHAVLYRRKMDGLLVIIKEINMLDLSATDRQMSLNEVKVS